MRIWANCSLLKAPLLLSVVLALVALHAVRAEAAESLKTQANRMVELSFTSRAEHADPFNQITLDVVFTDPGGVARRVPAFWDGGKLWKARYASPVVGVHRYVTECSDRNDPGLNGVRGEITVEAYHGSNPLYLHGPVRVVKGSRYLEHIDGTPFFWLGDTWWMGLSKRLAFPRDFNALLADRKAKGFNVVQIVAGLYPDMPPFDERGANEAGFPWEKDYSRIRPQYFDAADQRILRLVDQGFAPCIVGAWGFHISWMGVAKMQQHQRYLYARWGALPMIWCVAGELNLPYYLNPDFPGKGQKQTAEWEKVLAYARSINAFDRPISAHPTGIAPLSMRGVLKNPSLLDFDMLQTPHGQMEVIGRTVDAVRFSYDKRPIMPVVNAEPSYEMLWDRTPAEVTRRVFWVCWANGVKGYTYGANGIWQINQPDKPYGNSPWGGGYGKIPWNQAMHLPGSEQVALGKKLLSAYAWQRFEPHPEWAAWADAPAADVPLKDWIWYPEGEPAIDAPIAARAFRRTFDLPADAKIESATLAITADDQCTAWLNGQKLGSVANWRGMLRVGDLAGKLLAGRNVLAVRAQNVKSDVVKNPAGLLCGMTIQLRDGRRIDIPSDAKWRASSSEPDGWRAIAFDDSHWHAAKLAARYGQGPWGKINSNGGSDPYEVPYAFGIPRQIRIVYVPAPRPVRLASLDPAAHYALSFFDPVTGMTKEAGPLASDATGHARVAPPATTHDWVLILHSAKPMAPASR